VDVVVYADLDASLSGLHEFCPGDCHELSVVINGGTEPYEASFLLNVGPINFPFTIPAYDVNNQLNICFDDPGLFSYDPVTNTLHVSVLLSGTGTISLENIVDDNGCMPDVIDPKFTTLEFTDGAEIYPAGPLEACDENQDGWALFDLTLLNEILNNGSGASILYFSDPGGSTAIGDPANLYSPATTVYAQIDDDDCPSAIEPVELIVIEIGFPGVNTVIEICNEENTVLDLLAEIGGDPGGIWFDEYGSGVDYSDPTNVDFSGLDPGGYLFSYTFLATDLCPENTATLFVTVDEPLNPGNDNEVGICAGSTIPVDLYQALGPDYEPNGVWQDLFNSGVDLTDPSQVDFSNVGIGIWDFTYTVYSINACPDQSATITLNIYEEPNPGTDNTLEVCNAGETSVDLETALGPHDNIGYWTDLDGSGVELLPAFDVDFSGIDTGNYAFSYTIPETDNCPEVSAVITVHVITLLDAGQDGYLQLCQGQPDTINLPDLITGEEDNTGFWSQISGNPANLTDPTQVILSNTMPGTDIFLYELINDCGTDSAFVFVEILPGVQAGQDFTLDVCQYSDTISLFAHLGPHDPGGIWTDEQQDTLTDPGNMVFQSLDTLLFWYILDGGAGQCGSDTAFATIQVIPAAFAGRDSSLFFCEGSDILLNLFDLIPELSDSTGTWIQLSGQPLDLSRPDSIQVTDIPIGTDSLIYVIDGVCNSDTASLVISIDNAPSAGEDYVLSICLTENALNLFDSLGAFTPGGTWYTESFTVVDDPFNLPVTIPGTQQFFYIIPAEGSCSADTAQATIFVETNPDAGLNNTVTVCEGSALAVNLFEALEGTPDSNGSWHDLNGTGVDMDNWNAIDFSSIGVGSYDFEYIVDPLGVACKPDTAVVTVNIIAAPNAGTSGEVSLCLSPKLTINLDSLLLDHDPGGEWSDPDGTGVDLSNPAKVELSDIPAGSYTFLYFIPAGNGCPPAQATITLELLETPDAGTDWSLSYCEGYMEPIDLYSGLGSSVDQSGVWNQPNGSGLNLTQPDQVDISGLSDGNYLLEYLLTYDPQCGTDTSLFTLNIESGPEPGSCDTVYVCNGPSADPVDFPEVLSGEDPNGEFRELTTSGVDLSDPTSVRFEGIIDGRYIFEYFFPGEENCPEISTRIYVNVLRSDESFIEEWICPDESFTVGTTVYNLDNPTGTEFLVNQNGCDSIVYINLLPREIRFEASHTDANCFDEGSIQITDVSGTGLPVWIASDELGLVRVDGLPVDYIPIPPGTYDLSMTNEVSCRYDTTMEIQPFAGFLFELDEEVTIQAGQAHQMQVDTDMIPVAIEWFPASGLSCTDCLEPTASPETDTEYTITLIDADGCLLTGSVMIRVEYSQEVIVPNAFSPNGDEHNAWFYAQSTYSVGTYDLTIFNRWGEKLFHAENLSFNDPESGWDGRYKDRWMMPGVYVYLIEYDAGSEKIQILTGDVLLIR
jgi:gliding motility-associated-like protein